MWPLNSSCCSSSGSPRSARLPTDVAWPATGVLVVSVVLALGWAWLFYVPHRLDAAALCLAGAAVLTWVLVVTVLRAETWAGLLLVPYALWLSVATALSVAYARPT